GRCGGTQAGGGQQPAYDTPPGAVAPVDEVAEAILGGGGGELRDAENLRCGIGGWRRCGAPADVLLQRAGDGHRGGAGEARNEALADGVRNSRDGHDATSCSSVSARRAPR